MMKNLIYIILIPCAVYSQNSQDDKKSNESSSYLLDSTYLYRYSSNAKDSSLIFKETYSYNLYGKTTKIYSYLWNYLLNQWTNEYGNEITYDNFGNKIYDEHILWNVKIKQWIKEFKYEYSYYNNNLIKSNKGLVWDTTINDWRINYLDEFEYNSYKEKTLEVHSYWGEHYYYKHKTEYYYYSDGNPSFTIDYNLDTISKNWIKIKKTIYTYDNKYSSVGTNFMWNDTTGQWVGNGTKTEIINDTINKKRIYSTYTFHADPIYSYWAISSSTEISFDSSGNIISSVSSYDGFYDSKLEYSYDNHNNNVKAVYSVWHRFTGRWIMKNFSIMTYDSNNNQITCEQHQCEINVSNCEIILFSKSYTHYSLHSILGYTNDSNKTIPESTNTLVIYPNPTHGYFTIESNDNLAKQGFVYNSLGQLVKTFNLCKGTTIINIESLSQGLYFLQIPCQEFIHNQKIIKE